MIGRLCEHKQCIEFVRLQQLLMEQVLKACDGEIRDAHSRFHDAMFVIAHDFLESLGAFGGEAEGGHVVDEPEFPSGNHDVNACDALP